MIVHVYVRYCVYVFMRVYVCVCVYYAYICVCVCVCLQGRHFLWDGGRCTPTFGSRGGYKGVHRFRGTRGYMKISMCYELSLHVDNDLR